VGFELYKDLFGPNNLVEKEPLIISFLTLSDFADLKTARVKPHEDRYCNAYIGRGSHRNYRPVRCFTSLTAYSLEDPQTEETTRDKFR